MSSSGASKKEIVETLMTFVSKETKTVNGKCRTHITYRCPKPTCTTKLITFQDKSGFQNPYAHLRSCYGKGKTPHEQDKLLQALFSEARSAAKNAGGTIKSHFQTDTLSEYEKAVIGYVRLIILCSEPFSITEDAEYRRFSKYDSVTTPKKVTETIMKLVELVEQRIAKEISGKKGALLFDGWTKHGTHYVCMILSYTKPVSERQGGAIVVRHVQQLALLAMSPMAKLYTEDKSDEKDCEDETVSFNAATHLQFFEDNFKYFDCSFADWCVCMISDNCSTNRKISTDCEKPLVGCLNHKLNLQVNKMVKDSVDLNLQIESVFNTMSAARGSSKNRTLLRNMTSLRAITPNATRWTGKCRMMKRFVSIRPELIAASNDADGSIPIDSSPLFLSKVKTSAAMLDAINAVTTIMQTRCFTLAQCRHKIGLLQVEIREAEDDPDNPLHGCTLGNEYLKIRSHLSVNPVFEAAVLKLQNNNEEQLTRAEKAAVVSLHKCESDTTAGNEEQKLTFKQKLAKRQKLEAPGKYICADFVLGSVAEVERVWSMAKFIMSDKRNSLKPLMFEALMFLKYNARFWGDQLIAEAMKGPISDRTKARLDEIEEQTEFDMESSDESDN